MKYFKRAIALLLVLWIVGDPATAALARPALWQGVTQLRSTSTSSFTCQALSVHLPDFWHDENLDAIRLKRALDESFETQAGVRWDRVAGLLSNGVRFQKGLPENESINSLRLFLSAEIARWTGAARDQTGKAVSSFGKPEHALAIRQLYAGVRQARQPGSGIQNEFIKRWKNSKMAGLQYLARSGVFNSLLQASRTAHSAMDKDPSQFGEAGKTLDDAIALSGLNPAAWLMETVQARNLRARVSLRLGDLTAARQMFDEVLSNEMTLRARFQGDPHRAAVLERELQTASESLALLARDQREEPVPPPAAAPGALSSIHSALEQIEALLNSLSGIDATQDPNYHPGLRSTTRPYNTILLRVLLWELQLLHDAGILTPVSQVFYFISGRDPTPGFGVRALWVADQCFTKIGQEMPLGHWVGYFQSSYSLNRELRGMPLIGLPFGEVHVAGVSVLDTPLIQKWSGHMRAGDVVFLKYPTYWLTWYLHGTRPISAVHDWFDELIQSLPTGVLVVLIEDAIEEHVLKPYQTLSEYLLGRHPEVLEDASREYLGIEGASRLGRINQHPLLKLGLHMGHYSELGLAGILSILKVREKSPSQALNSAAMSKKNGFLFTELAVAMAALVVSFVLSTPVLGMNLGILGKHSSVPRNPAPYFQQQNPGQSVEVEQDSDPDPDPDPPSVPKDPAEVLKRIDLQLKRVSEAAKTHVKVNDDNGDRAKTELDEALESLQHIIEELYDIKPIVKLTRTQQHEILRFLNPAVFFDAASRGRIVRDLSDWRYHFDRSFVLSRLGESAQDDPDESVRDRAMDVYEELDTRVCYDPAYGKDDKLLSLNVWRFDEYGNIAQYDVKFDDDFDSELLTSSDDGPRAHELLFDPRTLMEKVKAMDDLLATAEQESLQSGRVLESRDPDNKLFVLRRDLQNRVQEFMATFDADEKGKLVRKADVYFRGQGGSQRLDVSYPPPLPLHSESNLDWLRVEFGSPQSTRYVFDKDIGVTMEREGQLLSYPAAFEWARYRAALQTVQDLLARAIPLADGEKQKVLKTALGFVQEKLKRKEPRYAYGVGAIETPLHKQSVVITSDNGNLHVDVRSFQRPAGTPSAEWVEDPRAQANYETSGWGLAEVTRRGRELLWGDDDEDPQYREVLRTLRGLFMQALPSTNEESRRVFERAIQLVEEGLQRPRQVSDYQTPANQRMWLMEKLGIQLPPGALGDALVGWFSYKSYAPELGEQFKQAGSLSEFISKAVLAPRMPQLGISTRDVIAGLIATGARSFSTYYVTADVLRMSPITLDQDAAILKAFRDPNISDGALPDVIVDILADPPAAPPQAGIVTHPGQTRALRSAA